MTSYTAFKNALLTFIRPKHVDTFGIHNPIGMQLLTRLRLGFSHLNEHKFRHNFREFLNPLCKCKFEPETRSHFLLRCHLLQVERTLDQVFWIKSCYMEMKIITMTQIKRFCYLL